MIDQMDEKNIALRLAHNILDRPYADPDDDLAILARQLLRMNEKLTDDRLHKTDCA